MKCPGCGSRLWDGHKCPACGRLASDTSRRLGSPPPPAIIARQAALSGAVGGAVAGYTGGGPLELDNLAGWVLWSAGLGAAAGLVVALVGWSAGKSLRDWFLWLLIPLGAGWGVLTVGGQELLDWGLGVAAARWGNGASAAVAGAVMGGVLAAGAAYLHARRREYLSRL